MLKLVNREGVDFPCRGMVSEIVDVPERYLRVMYRMCYVLDSNRRKSYPTAALAPGPTTYSLVIESVTVDPETEQNKGHFKSFINELIKNHLEPDTHKSGLEMIVIEGVGNEILAAALRRWGWEEDPGVSDFYYRKGKAMSEFVLGSSEHTREVRRLELERDLRQIKIDIDQAVTEEHRVIHRKHMEEILTEISVGKYDI